MTLQRRIELEVATRVAEALVQPLATAKARLLVHEARGADAGAARREHDQLLAALEQHLAQARRINEDLTGTPRLVAEGVSQLSAKLDHTEELQQRLDLVYTPAAPAPAAAHAAPAPIVRGRGARRRPPAPRRRVAAARTPAHGHPEAEISWEARGARTANAIRPLAEGMSQEDQIAVCMKVALEELGRKLDDLPAADAADLRRGVLRGLSQRGAAPAAPAPAPTGGSGRKKRRSQ